MIKLTDGIPLDPKQLEAVPCEAYDLSLNYKITSKDPQLREEVLGRGLYIDVGIIKLELVKGYKYFIIAVNNTLRFKKITFVKEKKEVATALTNKIKEL